MSDVHLESKNNIIYCAQYLSHKWKYYIILVLMPFQDENES